MSLKREIIVLFLELVALLLKNALLAMMIGIAEDIALLMLKIAELDILIMDANSVIESRPFQQSIGITDGRWLDIFSIFSIY